MTEHRRRVIKLGKSNGFLILGLRLAVLILFGLQTLVAAQQGSLVREVVHTKSVENTATGEDPNRNVSIYLPPTYKNSQSKRYPVLYLLHGIGGTDADWHDLSNTVRSPSVDDGYETIQDVMNKGIAAGKFGEMIIVMPDQRTKWFGSFYVNSASTGNWDDFTSKELVAFIDAKYRTIPKASARGIAGHSMGGYGALTLSMKHPDVFSVGYGLNSAIIDWAEELSLTFAASRYEAILSAKSFDDLLKDQDLYTMAIVNISQAFSPNPNNPPFYIDLPFKKVGGKWKPNEPAFTKWREHSPIRMVQQYRENLERLRGYRFDSGYDDEYRFIPVTNRAMSLELTNNGVDHIFEEYTGDHRNKLWGEEGRIYTALLPYFDRLLDH